jgi:hypothetical protein
MRKTLLSVLLMVMMTVAAFADKEDLYVLHADFEDGKALPEGWTSESVFGAQDWIVEQGGSLDYPAGAAVGNGRVALRNTTEQTQGFITRLITPAMDLTVLNVQPMLIFSHAQAQRLGDVDVLKVFYRTSPEARWIQLAEFDEKITKWQVDTIYLDAYSSKTYQIAFEGTDRFGRGIVLDEIIVRPDIVCEDARDIHARSLSGDEAIIEWGGSLDTDSFEVVVSKKLYENMDDVDWSDTAIIRHEFVYDFIDTLQNLDINTSYYIYIKAYCPSLEGQWVGGLIKTLNKVKVPFVEHFDAPYNKDNPSQAPNWTYGTSMYEDDGVTMRKLPYLTNYRTESMWKNYSPNATPALEFASAINAKVLPAGEYAYAASPEIDIENIQDAYVDFWATCYLYYPGYSSTDYAAGIIVGIMENPADYSTFVPVDTCYAINGYKFEQFRVKFDKYNGIGKYVAFASDFKDDVTLFWVDEVTIGSIKEAVRPMNFTVHQFTPTSAVVEPELYDATAWNVIVSDIKTDDPDKLKPANILVKLEDIPASKKDTMIEIANMEGKWVRFYVQAVQGEDKSEWSASQKYMMPNSLASSALPKTWDFETKGTTSYEQIWEYTSQTPGTIGFLQDGLIQHVANYADGYRSGSTTESYAHGGSYTYHLNKRDYRSPYLVFPQLDSLNNKMFTFYYSDAMGSGYSQPYYQVGVMTDPQDTATFAPLKTYSDAEQKTWGKGEIIFLDYTGDARYIAIRLIDGPNTIAGKLAYGCIDDVTISALDDCIKPLNVEATSEDSTITIKWDANGMTQWAVAVSENWEKEDLYIRDTVNTNQITIKNLNPHTTYTYQITTLVGAKKAASDIFTVKTQCAPFELIPYKEDFEYIEKSYSDPNPNGPNCWTMPLHKDISSSSTYYFPYVTTSNAHGGNQKLNFGRHFGTTGSSMDSCYAALPLFNKDVKNLQLSFYIRGLSSYVNDTLYVGIMSDPNDIKTFDTVYTFTVTGMDYKEHIVNFSSYAKGGQYITFYKPVTNHYYMIDDVEVKEIPACEKVFDIKTKGIHDRGATFSWYKKDATKWQFVVATKKDLSAEQLAAPDASIVLDSIIEANPFALDDDAIEANKQYYAYIRAVCDGANYGDWSAPAAFKTVCTARGIDDFGGTSKVEDFSQSSTSDCWKFGDRVGSGTHNILNGHIQLINSSASTDGAYAIARKLNIDSLQYLQVTFDAWNSTTTYPLNEVTVGIITNPEDLSTFVPLDVVKFKMAADADDHEAYTVRFNEYMGDYNDEYGQFVMFISESGENSNKIELDNIYFDSISAYLEPLDIWADSIGENVIKLHWENTKADSYEYKYSDKLTTLGAATPVAVDADSALISGLAMLKTYYVQVRAKYGENYSRWSNWRQFTTECPASQTLPWSENFDKGSSSTSYKNTPQCWGAFGSDGTVGSDCITPTVYNSAKKDGVGGLYIGGSKTVASYTILPRFDADLSKAILAFEYKLHTYSSSYEDSLWIGVAKNVENLDSLLNSITWIDQMVEKRTTSAANVWTKYQKKLEGAGDAQYIVLKAKSTYTTYSTSTKYGFYIDNMSVEPEASCNKPEAPVAVLRDLNGLGFSWTDTIASNWDAVALPKGDAPDENTTPAVTVDTTYAFISGLQPKTEYDLYVRANCGAGDVSYWVGPVTMKTLSAAAYPFFTDFEAEPTEMTPGNSTSYKIHEGWISGLGKGTSASYYPYVRQDPTAATATYAYSYGHDENHSRALYMQAYSASIDSAFIVLPALYDNAANAEVNLDTVQIRFQARMMTSGIGTKDKQIPNFQPTGVTTTGDPSTRYQKVTNQRVLQIGTMTNPMDIKTFQLIDAFELAPVLSVKDTIYTDEDPRGNNWWEEISVPLAGAKGKYIAFMYPYATTASYMNIDNLYVEKAVGLYAPNAVKGVASSKNSITITWTNRFNAPKVDVGYIEAGGALADVTVVTTDKDTLEITGLESNKQYDFYVRANDGAGKTSNWSAGNILATRYVVDLADASWDFDRKNNYVSQTTGNLLPLGWIVGSKYATSTSYIPKLQFNAVNTTTLAVTTAYSRQKVARNGALYIQSFVSSTNNSDGAYAIMPQINGNLEDKELHFWARACAMTVSNGNATSATSGTYATEAYPRAIKVGYVTDPNNIESFVELADIQLPALSSSTAKASEDASGNEFWNEISVPLKGIGEGKYIAFLSEYGNTNNVWIDQINFREANTCYTPNRPTIDSIGAHAAKFSWQLGEGQWAILLSTTKNEAQVIRDTVSERTYRNDTLLANTPYVFKVKKICGELVESDEVSFEFTTNCDAYDKEKAAWSFSDKLVDMKIGTTTNKVPECWVLDLEVRSSASYASYCPKAEPNTASVILAKEATKTTSDRALQFYTTTSNYNAYAVLPPLDVNRDSTILHFFGRAARFNKTFNSTNKTFLNAINNAYLRKLVVGTMSDPKNLETFVAVDTITYDHVWPVLKESNLTQDSLDANNEYWQEYILDLKNYKGGEFIAFLAPKPDGTSYFYIDELSIMDAETCTEISSVTVNDITKNAATVNWTIPKGVENFYLEVSTDKEFEDTTKFVLRDTINTLTYNITNLEPATEYFARVKHICSAQQQSEFATKSFTTLYAIRFTEQFTEERSIPANWALYNYKDMQPTNTNSWERKSGETDDNMYGPYMSSDLTGSWKRWLATPQIDLSDVTSADSIALSFDMAITNKALAQEDSVFFLVLISTDGGLTYPEEYRTVWGTTADCDYPFSAISNKKKGTRWFIDLSKFNGQVIRIMFGTDVTKISGSGYLYLDNVQLNYYTKDEYAESICEWTEYEDANFTIDANDLKVDATTNYEKFTQTVKEGEKDKLARLTLTVTGSAETLFEDEICEGASYEGNGFVIEEVKTGTYRRKLAGSNSCDSVATLNLTVLSKQYENVEVTICQGNYYEFNGVKYYTSTIHSDTLPAANGCDSIVTLYLTVNPILVGETEEVFLCPDSAYYFSEKYPALTEAGIYKDTIQNAQGCDSVISVDIKNVPNMQTLIRAAICEGEVYNKGVFGGLTKPGDYPSQQKTVYGCDSIVTLHLLVATATAEQTYELKDSVSVENLPYVLNDEEILPVGTEEGVYTRTINLNCGEATLVITVGNPQGINNTFVNSLAVMPNPAQVGEPIRILGTFDDATVEVTSATGALVYTAQNLINPITIPGMPVAGVYLIRLRENGRIYQAKLMVK